MSLLKVAGTTASSGTLYVDDVFSTWLYTGNGSTQTITNGIDLAGKGGLVWVKSRSAATDHKLTDTVRGATKALISDTTGAETTDTTGLTAFSSTGFSLGANSVYNTNAATYASWTFRKAAKFFDVQTVTHTNGTANNIDLSVLGTVGMVIAKITTTTGDWTVWQRSLTASNNLKLNTTAAQSTTNAWLSVSGTTATLSASAPTGTYVIYGYAHDTSSTGIIQCGSYTGTGAVGNTINLGWEPQYVMIKCATSITNWLLMDSMRGMPDGSTDAVLIPNLADAESSVEYVSPTATGFKIMNTVGVINTSGATYIYMAIRMPNKPPTTGTQVYNAIARTGTRAAATVTGVGFTPDIVIADQRSGAGLAGTEFVDRLRGSTQMLCSAATASESDFGSPQTDSVTSFGMDGVSVGIDGQFARINYQIQPHINWFFKRAPKFFDEVCYTGTGVATTQAHNLTAVPELIIVKERSAANDWWVYDAIDGNTKYSVLNSTAIPVTSSTAWNNTTPTASVFSIGTATNVNASAQTFVAYLFATLAGISKVGSYTGNGTGQAIACGFSGGARFVLIKRTDSTGNWYTFDSARGLTSGSSPYLLLNSSAAETTGNNGVYASSGGFTLGATAITTTNIATASYIFLAIA